jgi:hypothetical protein
MKVNRLWKMSDVAQVAAEFGACCRDAFACVNRAKHAETPSAVEFYRVQAREAGERARDAWAELRKLEGVA